MENKETQSPESTKADEVAGNVTVTANSASVKKGNNPFWMIAAIVLAIALVLVIIFPIGGKSETLATVNGTKITKDDLYNTLETYYNDSIVSIVDRMVTEELVNQEAKAKNITLTDKDLVDEVAAMKLDYGGEEGFQQFLAYYGMTEDDLKNELKLSATVRLLLQSEIEITDEQVQAYFDENKEKIGGSAEKVRASHILVTDKDLAEDILAQLKNGADFAELAKEYSTDGSAANGGDLGYFTADKMVDEFSEAAFALKDGEISDIVQSQYGYHIIKRTGYEPATEANFDDLKDAIKVKLVNDEIYANHSTYVEDLRAAAKITNKVDPESAVTDTNDLSGLEDDAATDSDDSATSDDSAAE